MAKKIKKGGGKPPKILTVQERMKSFDGDILQGKYDVDYLKRNNLYGRTIHKKSRYWCFKMMHSVTENKPKPKAPKGFYKFVEGLPGFAGWKYFAHTWDIHGENPFMIVLRLQSVWSEWDNVMNRVAIPFDSPPEQIHERMEALARNYAKNN